MTQYTVHFNHWRKFLYASSQSTPTSQRLIILIIFYHRWVFSDLECHINWTMQYELLGDWLPLLIMFARFIYVLNESVIGFFFFYGWVVFKYLELFHVIHTFIYPFSFRWWAFGFPDFVSKTSLNIVIQAFL